MWRSGTFPNVIGSNEIGETFFFSLNDFLIKGLYISVCAFPGNGEEYMVVLCLLYKFVEGWITMQILATIMNVFPTKSSKQSCVLLRAEVVRNRRHES